MARLGCQADLDALERVIPGVRQRTHWLDVPLLAISASDLRRRVRQGLPLRYLVPPPVEAYIRQHQLYSF